MFKDGTESRSDSVHVLDRWILARLQELVNDSTAGYKGYELDKAVRPITDFIDDLSVWYLRRSRDRLKGDDAIDKALALASLRYTLRTLALVMAPVMPFYAEYLWQAVKEEDDVESVHLGKWPETGDKDLLVLDNMNVTRNLISKGLEIRTKQNAKVKQPLAKAEINFHYAFVVKDKEYAILIEDELNVKSVEMNSTQEDDITLDTTLTPELIAEGNVRELMRAVQGRRKTEGLLPQDTITLTISTSDTGCAAIEANYDMLVKTVGASELIFADTDGEVVATDTEQFVFTIKKL
jgi:isoleucyl-tRNA synthetase